MSMSDRVARRFVHFIFMNSININVKRIYQSTLGMMKSTKIYETQGRSVAAVVVTFNYGTIYMK